MAIGPHTRGGGGGSGVGDDDDDNDDGGSLSILFWRHKSALLSERRFQVCADRSSFGATQEPLAATEALLL